MISFLFFFRLDESNVPSSSASRLPSDRLARRSIDEDIEPTPEELGILNEIIVYQNCLCMCVLEHRKQFEMHRKKHYNEFEIVRLRKKEIEDELRALEQDDSTNESSGKGANK